MVKTWINLLKRACFGAAICFWACTPASERDQSGSGTDTETRKKVQQLLDKMSLEEKVGQMTQVNLNVILKDGYGNQDGSIDKALLKKAVVDYKVGSLLNAINHAYPLETWHQIITAIQEAAQETPNQIPVIYGIDAIHGTNFTLGSTLFPHNIGIAATFNPDLAKEIARITAKETRASGIRWNFDPVMDLGRQPLWPRFPETFGEDVFLVSTLGTAVVEGYQEAGLNAPDGVAACLKHYVGYSAPASGKDRTPAYIPEILLREYYLPPFQKGVKAGAATIMVNSGEINGIPVHNSSYLLKDVLRDELGFEGVIVTDWEDVIRLHTRHRVAETPKEAVRMAVEAGIDMSMVPHDFTFYEYLLELVKEGAISEKRIDESVARILKLKYDLGLFDDPFPEPEAVQNFGKAAFKKVAFDAARESITLLKNEQTKGTGNPVLPLSKDARILLMGPAADNITSLHGSWSYTWQGNDTQWYPESIKTIREAIEESISPGNLIYIGVPDYESIVNYDATALKAKASTADAIILCLGEDAYAESPGVINDLTLGQKQLQLAEAAIQTGKPVILVLIEGRPRLISSIEPGIQGIIQAYQPGSQGAQAIAEVLFGEYNPHGVLPYSYPRFSGDIIPYDHKLTDEIQELEPGVITQDAYNPQFPFGHGLSYTTFEYSNLLTDKDAITGKDSLQISVTVKNTGTMAGKETVLLFVRDEFASLTPPVKRLRAFKKVELQPGQETKVDFVITQKDLAFVNDDLKWITEPGAFEIQIDTLKKRFTIKDQ